MELLVRIQKRQIAQYTVILEVDLRMFRFCSAYIQLFQQVMKSVMDFYQPTCVVLQVRTQSNESQTQLSIKIRNY